jgi:hypothetical protein
MLDLHDIDKSADEIVKELHLSTHAFRVLGQATAQPPIIANVEVMYIPKHSPS